MWAAAVLLPRGILCCLFTEMRPFVSLSPSQNWAVTMWLSHHIVVNSYKAKKAKKVINPYNARALCLINVTKNQVQWQSFSTSFRQYPIKPRILAGPWQIKMLMPWNCSNHVTDGFFLLNFHHIIGILFILLSGTDLQDKGGAEFYTEIFLLVCLCPLAVTAAPGLSLLMIF